MRNHVEWFILCIKFLFVSAIVCGVSYLFSEKVPTRFISTTTLQKEPLQTLTTKASFTMEANGHKYQINPVHEYEIWGLVVSDHRTDSWSNTTHESWNDYINTKDICVIWGANLTNPFLDKLKFSHGSWTCYVHTKSAEAWQNFKMDQLSNNHLIPSNEHIRKLIENSRVGDEIRIKGQLVNYNVDGRPFRNTSVNRTDKENGACEIIYVNEFETMARNNIFWSRVYSLSKFLCVAFVMAALFFIFVVPFLSSKE